MVTLGKVKQILAGKGISEKQIEEDYHMISGSGRYPARMPSHYLATAIELVERERAKPGAVQIFISPEPTSYALGRPSVTFAVLALDWPGLLNSCTGTLHEKGFNISFCEAVIIDEPKQKLGLVFMEIDVNVRQEFEKLLRLEPEIGKTLIRTAAQETGKRRLLMSETQRAEQYTLVVEELKKIADPSDYNVLFDEEKGEAVRFFLARTMAYLNERSPVDLAHQIYTNYTFTREVRKTGKIYAWAGNIDTPGGKLTAVSVAGLEHDLSLGDCFRVIDEVAPGYQRKYDKAFITGDAINVIRIEIVDAQGESLSLDQCRELSQKLIGIQDAPVCDRVSPGVEMLGRKICPILLEEERKLALPQVYMHPHSRSNIKVVVVSSGDDRGHAFELIESISQVKGLEAGMPDPVSTVTTCTNGERTAQEVAIIDVWVDFAEFFGTPKGPYNDELILVRIEKAIRKTGLIGPRLRIFDRTGRQLRRARSERVSSLVRKQGYDPEMARHIIARMGDRLVVAPTVSDNEILRPVLMGIRAIEQWRKSEGAVPVIVWGETQAGPAARGASYSLLAAVYDPRSEILPELIKEITPYGLESSTVIDGEDYRLAIFRVAHQGKSLEQSEIDQLSTLLRRLLNR
jgi:acetolactate synthase small subunit